MSAKMLYLGPEQEAVTRQEVLRSTHEALEGRARSIENFPIFLEEAIEKRIWEHTRTFSSGKVVEPTTVHAFVHDNYPMGLGSTYAKIESIITGNAKLSAIWYGVTGRVVPELEPSVALVPVNDVIVGDDRRAVRDVAALVASIREVGLLQPIVITEGLRLVAGRHRLEAFRQLGRMSIPARIVSLSEVDAQLAEIDENLARHELTALERAEQLAKRKVLYEAKHPETRHGGAPGKAGKDGGGKASKEPESGSLPPSFVESTSKLMGKSKSTIKEEVQIANDLAPDVKESIRDLPIADEKTKLLDLSKKSPAQQREAVEALKTEPKEKSGTKKIPNEPDPLPRAVAAIAKVPFHRLAELVAALPEQTRRTLRMVLADMAGAVR